jgi:hypothetical protein
MARPPTSLWKVQAALVGTMVALTAGIGLAVVMGPGEPEDWGIHWERPASMTIDSVTTDAGGEALAISVHLWDGQGHATEWGGTLEVELADEDLAQVHWASLHVGAGDFTTTRSGDVVDTRYVLLVPLTALAHVTARMLDRPSTDVSVRAAFTFEDQTLAAERWWWPAPASLVVQDVEVDPELECVLVDLVLLDGTGWSTKRSGELRLAIEDSRGTVMYDRTVPVLAGEFNLFAFWGTGWTWYGTWVDFADIGRSNDRLENGSEGVPGRLMRVTAWFACDGASLGPAGADGCATVARIPDALLLPNAPPVPSLETGQLGLAGRQHDFDASLTADDTGPRGLRYEWSWGDGSRTEATDGPYASHTFPRAGSFLVVLRVTDVEGASASVNASVRVLRDPIHAPGDAGDGWMEGLPVVGDDPAVGGTVEARRTLVPPGA